MTYETTTPADAAVEAWRDWRRAREEDLTQPHGWLSLTALHWLSSEPRSLPDLPGLWSMTDTTVTVQATTQDGLVHDGQPIDRTTSLTPRDGAPGELISTGQRRIEAIRRGDSYAVRVRDPEAPTRTQFGGVPTYAFDPAWAVTGVIEPFDTPREVTVGAVVEGLTHRYTGLGRVRFWLAGHEHALTVYPGYHGAGGFAVQFRDATTGVTTHPSSRAVTIPAPDPDGRVVIDFNRAVNLPCAFTDHATCPLAPTENTLTIAVEAGEQHPTRR